MMKKLVKCTNKTKQRKTNNNYSLSHNNKLTNITTATTLGLAGFTALSGLVLASGGVLAEGTGSTDNLTVTIDSACTMTTNGNNSHSTTLVAGHLQEDIGTTNFDIACNDDNGYSVYAVGYTNNEYGNTDLEYTVLEDQGGGLDPIEQTYTIATGIFDAGNTNTSVWSMKLTATENQTSSGYTPDIETGYDDYIEVPDTFTKVVSKDSPTDVYDANEDEAELNTARFTSTYSVYATPTQHTGTYKGKVAYVLVHPEDADTPTEEDIVVTPEEQQTTGYIMQNVANWKDSIQPGQEVTAIDARDNKTYTVAKLADGNLWMTQNLDLDINSARTYTPADTDIASNWTPVASTHQTDDTEWNQYNANTNPDGGDDYHAESYDPGDLYWNGTTINDQTSCESAGGTWDGWCSGYTNPTSSTGDSHYHLGNYYNWTAAVAMNNSSDYTTDGTLIEQSICPAGWTLPRVGTGDDTFGALWSNESYGFGQSSINQTTNKNLWDAPLYFAASGYWGGELGDVGVGGYFWPSVVRADVRAYDAYFGTNGDVNPGDYDYRLGGSSVRCVARPVASTVFFDTGGDSGDGGR